MAGASTAGAPAMTAPTLAGRHVVLGVCASIAAYKAVELCRRMVAAGAEVTPVLTRDAERFVGPATFAALASHPAPAGMWAEPGDVTHTRLGRSADVVVVAPATANLLASYRAGLAQDLLTATLLATRSPVVLAPAMHAEMWEHPATVDNVAVLRQRGVALVGPEVGLLAGGDTGAGRLATTAEVLAWVEHAVTPHDLAGRRVVVSAGGTREPVDPVRHLTNRSSGRQGHALAAEAFARGAAVTLVTAAEPGGEGLDVCSAVEVVRVDTAAEMAAAVGEHGASADVVIMAAAVADYTPARTTAGKLDRRAGAIDLELEPTVDILATTAASRRPGQVLVGFAAQLGDPGPGAVAKARSKGVDVVVGNDVSAAGIGFGSPDNAVVIATPEGVVQTVEPTTKREVASAVLGVVARLLASH